MENKKIRTIFFGAGNFAAKLLPGLKEFPFLDLVAVVTQPDKPAGREKKLKPCPVKEVLNFHPEWELDVLEPLKLKLESAQILEKYQPDFILVADYSQMIPKDIIDYPKFKCLNVHGSLLPDLRGAVPATMAILKGYRETGVSIPVMTPGLDDGDVVAARKLEILAVDNTYTLRMRLAEMALELLQEVLPQWFNKELVPTPQDHSRASVTYEKDIAKDKARISKDSDAISAERMIRAFNPWPVAWVEVEVNNAIKRLKLFKSKLGPELDCALGSFTKLNGELYLNLKGGSLLIEELQIEGKPVITGKDGLYLKGNKIR